MKAAALAMARQAELRTVNADQTIFLQGFEPSAFSFYSAMFAHYPDSTLFLGATTLGEIGDGFYFVLQGSVKVKVNNRIVKVRCSLRLSVCFPDSADHRPPCLPILMVTYPILHHSSGPWQQDYIRRACDAAQMQTLCLG